MRSSPPQSSIGSPKMENSKKALMVFSFVMPLAVGIINVILDHGIKTYDCDTHPSMLWWVTKSCIAVCSGLLLGLIVGVACTATVADYQEAFFRSSENDGEVERIAVVKECDMFGM